MTEVPPAPQDSRHLRRLVEHAVAAYEQRGAAGLAEALRAAGSDADAVRARLETLRASGLLETAAPSDPATREARADAPPRLGEFVPQEKIGEGAMGVVWRAEQPSLRRQVALKVIRPEYTWIEGARERFRREAEAVARLRHPAIVPVYAVGEENGVSYLAFELVEGLALDRLLEELARRGAGELRGEHALAIIAARDGRGALAAGVPALFRGRWIEVVVRILQELADALAHAHERGILHRDLKPSNVMLTRDGAVRLLDFGLAAAEGAPSLTREGAAPGSLAYMAPELLTDAGARANVRSEVYALGVCAYELLRLRPPFEGHSMLEVRSRILRSDFEALRTSRDGLPWELLAIVETAMERSPQRRYADLRAFAEDLRRFAAREPIAARRSGPLRRAARWIQRHPVAATALSLGALLLAAVPSAIAVQAAHDAEEVRRALARATDAGTRAEQSVLALLAGVERMLVEVAALELRSAPGADAARRKIIGEAEALYRDLEAREGARPEIRRALLRTALRRANMLLEHDRLAEAEVALSDADRARAAIQTQDITQDEALRLDSERLGLEASIARTRGDAETSLALLGRALRTSEELLALDPRNGSAWLELARRCGEAGTSAGLARNFDLAFPHYERAEAAFARILQLDPNASIYGERGQIRFSHAGARGNSGSPSDATHWARLAIADLERALADEPESEDLHEALASTWQILAVSALLLEDPAGEREAIERCAAERRWLLQRFPDRAVSRIAMAESCRELARLHRPGGPLENDAEAVRLTREAEQHLRAVTEPSSDRDFVLGMVLHDRAFDSADTPDELPYLREALALCRGLLDQSAHRSRSLQLGSFVAAKLAYALAKAERHDEAATAAADAQGLALQAFEMRPDRPEARQRAIDMALLRADLLALRGSAAEAVELLRALHARVGLKRAEVEIEQRVEPLRGFAAFQRLVGELPE